MAEYRLSQKAIEDLDGILDYTLKYYGEAQADKYVGQLNFHLAMLADNPNIAPERAELSPTVRMFSSGGHLIIYQTKEDHILVVRIAHGKMNLKRLL